MVTVTSSQDFLGLLTSLCLHVSEQHCTSINSSKKKRIRSKALKNILFPCQPDNADHQCVLVQLRGLWFSLHSCGRRQRATRLQHYLDALGERPSPEVRSVLRLLLLLADQRLTLPPPPAPLGQLREEPSTEDAPAPVCAAPPPPRFPVFPAPVFCGDGRLSGQGAPPAGLLQRPPGTGARLFGAQELSQPGGPLGALVQSRARVEPGERLRLPPLPLDPARVPFAPETLPWDLHRAPAPSTQTEEEILQTQLAPSLSSPTSADLCWEEVWRLPPGGRLSWESRGRQQYRRAAPCLTSAGPAVLPPLRRLALTCYLLEPPQPARPVPMSLLLRDLRLMLMGVDTGCFPYDVDKGEYRAAPGLCIDTLTPEALADRCATWVKCGSWCRRVAALVSEGGGGAVQKAFATGLEPCLRGYRCAVTEVETTTLMSFERRVKPLTRLMALMADVAWVETRGSEMPQKMALVTELYDRLVGSSEATEMALLAHLFKATIAPYLRFLSLWLLEGMIRDPHAEFPVSELVEFSRCEGEVFWTAGYRRAAAGAEDDHPRFLQSVSGAVFECGRALALLRRCQPDHPLCRAAAPPVQLAFSAPQLREIQQRVHRYEVAMRPHVAGTFTRHLSERRRQLLQLQTAAAERRLVSLSALQESQQTYRQRKAEGKRQLLQELTAAAEEARANQRRAKMEDRILTEKVEAERRKMELRADEEENRARLARLARLAGASAASTASPAVASTDTTLTTVFGDRAAIVLPAAAETTSASSADIEEPMSTSADPSPETEVAPPSVSGEVAKDVVTVPADRSVTSADDVTDNAAGRRAGVRGVQESTVTVNSSNPDQIGAGTEAPVFSTVSMATQINNERTQTDSSPLNNERFLITNIAASSSVVDALNANATRDRNDENANVAADVTDDVTAAGWRGERRTDTAVYGWGEEEEEAVLVDLIGGEVLRRRGRNVHGHATDSRIQRLIYYGRGEAEPAPAPAPGPARWFQPGSGDSAPRFLAPQFGGALPIVADLMITTELDTEQRTESAAADTELAADSANAATEAATASAANQESADDAKAAGDTGTDEDVKTPAQTETTGNSQATAEPSEDVERTSADAEGATGVKATAGERQTASSSSLTASSLPQIAKESPPSAAAGAVEEAPSADRPCQFTLAGTLHRSISLLVKTQLSLVNAALLNHMLVTSQLPEQLEVLRGCLLLGNGEFAARLSAQLFNLVDTARTPHQLLNPVTLNAVLGEALAASAVGEHPLAERLSFVISCVPDVLDRAAPEVLDCVALNFQYPVVTRTVPTAPEVLDCVALNFAAGWPQCLVVTERSLLRYRALFQLLLRLRRAVAALEATFGHLKTIGELETSQEGAARLQRLQLCRHEMQHFILALQQYFTSQVLLVEWAELQRQLAAVHTLDDLRSAHINYIERAASRCLLNPKAEPIMNVISDIFRIVLKFEFQLSAAGWSLSESGAAANAHFATVMKTYRQFTEYSRFLFKVVNKAKDRYYQPHLSDLVNRLNLNDHYCSQLPHGREP